MAHYIITHFSNISFAIQIDFFMLLLFTCRVSRTNPGLYSWLSSLSRQKLRTFDSTCKTLIFFEVGFGLSFYSPVFILQCVFSIKISKCPFMIIRSNKVDDQDNCEKLNLYLGIFFFWCE